MSEHKEGDLKIWWIPQVPCDPFEVPVSSVEEAAKLLDVLARYDEFQYEHSIKPDYSNAGGLAVLEGGEWIDWEHPETGMSLEEYMEEQTNG